MIFSVAKLGKVYYLLKKKNHNINNYNNKIIRHEYINDSAYICLLNETTFSLLPFIIELTFIIISSRATARQRGIYIIYLYIQLANYKGGIFIILRLVFMVEEHKSPIRCITPFFPLQRVIDINLTVT